MKILHISVSDKGGAGTACVRLHRGLLKNGVDSDVLVLDKFSSNIPRLYQFDEYKNQNKIGKSISFFKRHIIPAFNEFKLRGRISDNEGFDFISSFFDITKHHLYASCDIVHLHFTCQFLDYKSFFKKNTKPIVWTLHDMNPFTGGCHYSEDCDKFIEDCGRCPQLNGMRNINLAKKILSAKRKIFESVSNLTIVSPSIWLKKESEISVLFKGRKHEVVAHGLDTNIFKQINKIFARELLSLPKEKNIALFISDDITRKNKGFELFLQALKMIPGNSQYIILTVGKNFVKPEDNEIEIINLGYIDNDLLLSAIYSVADVLAVPSFCEAFSLITIESLACATPVVAFDSSGPQEIISHKIDGYLADPGNKGDFAEGIAWIAANNNIDNPELMKNARKKIIDYYSDTRAAREYMKIYLNSITIVQ